MLITLRHVSTRRGEHYERRISKRESSKSGFHKSRISLKSDADMEEVPKYSRLKLVVILKRARISSFKVFPILQHALEMTHMKFQTILTKTLDSRCETNLKLRFSQFDKNAT